MIKQSPIKLLFQSSNVRTSIRRASTGPSSSHPTDYPPSSGAAKLTNRRLISIHGADSPQFLQGLTSNTINPRQTSGQYSAFLTAQGRVLNDVFIYPSAHSRTWTKRLPESFDRSDPGYLIEVDAGQAEKLVTHLRRYKLRARIAVRLLEEGEGAVWSVWGVSVVSGREGGAEKQQQQEEEEEEGGRIGCVDTRAPGMGRRVVVLFPGGGGGQDKGAAEEVEGRGVEERSLHDYTVRRMLKGVPEGQTEMVREIALPHESNLDLMGAVDFRKGCYVGQELTIRTQHTGVVRKRILPVRLYGEGEDRPEELMYDPQTEERQGLRPPGGTNIFRVGDERKRAVGKWLSGVGNIGLALCRLESMTDYNVAGSNVNLLGGAADAGRLVRQKSGQGEQEREFMAEWVTENGKLDGRVKVKAFVPTWLGITRDRAES